MAVFPRISNGVLVGLAFISLFSAHPAAAAMNAEDGKRLKTIFTDIIAQHRAEMKAQGGDLITEGEVMVEPSDTYYAITLPHITTINADKSKMNLGMVSINALPGDKKEEWKMTVAIPTPITMYAPDGKEDGVLEIGSQNFAGVFHEKLRNFVRITAKYQNLTFTNPSEKIKINVAELSALNNTQEGPNKLWSGPMSANAHNITVTFGKDGDAAKIGDIDFQGFIKDYSIEEDIKYRDNMTALLESTGKDMPSASNQHVQGMYNMFFDYLANVWDGFGSNMTVSNIEIASPPKEGTPSSTMKIAKMGVGLEGNGFRQNKVTLRHTLNITDLAITPPPTGLKKISPSNVNIDIALNNLPFKELVELGKKTLNQSMETPEGKSLAAMNGLATMQQLMTNAGTTLTVKDSRVGNAVEYDILVNGTATANIKALMGATAKTRLEIFGIEKLVAYTQQAATDPTLTPETQAQAQSLLQSFTILQMVGQQGKNAKGQDIRSYDLELTADGKTLLNGADLMTVMGGSLGAPKTAPAAPTPAPKAKP